MPVRRRPVRVLTVVALLPLAGLLAAAVARATSLPVRTYDVAGLADLPPSSDGDAADASLSGDGAVIAFDAPKNANAAGSATQVYVVDVFTGAQFIASATPGGAPANGSSSHPSISYSGKVVAFASTATDLGPKAVGGRSNIYARLANGRIELVSQAPDGADANAGSSQPEISGDGKYVAYTSTATNLVPRDGSSRPQVFLTNLSTGKTVLISKGRHGLPGNGWSGDPAIDANGGEVTFDSSSSNLVKTRFAPPQVFLRYVGRTKTELVSVTPRGAPQNKAVSAPFQQRSSISADGSRIVFDSNANNLVLGDDNARTDIFLRDLSDDSTTLVSENNAGYEGNDDSFWPTISPDGTKVAYESFATNLAPGGGPLQNVFITDLDTGSTSVVDVGPTGQRLSRERVRELLERPVLSYDGYSAVFETTAANLSGDERPQTRLFLRLLDPPAAEFTRSPPRSVSGSRVVVYVGADDPAARVFSCRVDSQTPFTCQPGKISFSHLSPGRHLLSIRAGGPGMLYQLDPLTTYVQVDQ